MKYSMLFKHSKGAGVCSGEANLVSLLFLGLVCLFKIKIKMNYFVKENFEGWEKEDYGTTKKVIPIKIFFKQLGRESRMKIIHKYILKIRHQN